MQLALKGKHGGKNGHKEDQSHHQDQMENTQAREKKARPVRASDLSIRFMIAASFRTYIGDHAAISLDLSLRVNIFFKIYIWTYQHLYWWTY